MAIATIDKMTLIVPNEMREFTLRLLQSYQKVEIINLADSDQTILSPPKGEYEQWKEALVEIEKAQRILSGFYKTDAIERLKNGRPIMTLEDLEQAVASNSWKSVCTEAINLHERLEILRSQRAENTRLINEWSSWKALPMLPRLSTREFKYVSCWAGTVPLTLFAAFSDDYMLLTEKTGYCEALFHKEDQVGVLLLFSKEMALDIEDLTRRYESVPCGFPFDGLPVDYVNTWLSNEENYVNEERELLKKLVQLADQHDALELAEEFFRNLLVRESVQEKMLYSNSSSLISGWLEKEQTASLDDLLKSELSYPYYLSFSEVEEQEIPDVPIVLKNKKVASAFETLTEMYSMPEYNEIDPTPVMTPFYLLFFGMMVADIGYGLVLMLATGAVRKFFKPDREMKRSMDFFFYLSFSVVMWGIIYGSLFGVSLPFALFSPTDDIIQIIVLSLVLGWIQLMAGLVASTCNSFKQKDTLGAFSNGISWIALLLSLALLVAKVMFENEIIFIICIILAVLSVVGIVFLPVVENKGHRIKGLLKGLYALYGATGYVGDLVSYTRLMALGVAGGSISIAFNTIIASLPLPARLTVGLLLAVVLHALNMFLSLLGAYVHGIRLQYVEFFGKFYTGGGRKFSPFKTVEKYIYIIEKNGKQKQKTEELV